MGLGSDPAGRPPIITTAVVTTATEVPAVVDPLFREYGEWVAGQLAAEAGITFTGADQDRHHDAFRAELPRLLGPPDGCSWPASTALRPA